MSYPPTSRREADPVHDGGSETWLVCGGRDFIDTQLFLETMRNLIIGRGKPGRIIDGGARGADTMAGDFAREIGCAHSRFHAEWMNHGRAAGAIRNQRMLDEGKPDLVIAFPGGRGTADMVRRARKAGIAVFKVRPLAPHDGSRLHARHEVAADGGGRNQQGDEDE